MALLNFLVRQDLEMVTDEMQQQEIAASFSAGTNTVIMSAARFTFAVHLPLITAFLFNYSLFHECLTFIRGAPS